MSTLPPVLHRSVRAITPNEFLEALQATCAPRFPGAQGRTHQPIGMSFLVRFLTLYGVRTKRALLTLAVVAVQQLLQ